MAMTLKEMLDRLPAERRRRVEARAEELIAEEMSLRDLRKAMHKTQVQLARKTGKSQVTLSRLERQSDMLISTLNEVVRGLGGRIRIVAELPDRPPVYLTGLADLSADARSTATARAGAAKVTKAAAQACAMSEGNRGRTLVAGRAEKRSAFRHRTRFDPPK
jgi:transcriptional regulator with XRE-family HTH domain